MIRVIGDSLAPVLRDGNKVAIDIRRTSPREGEVVAVYHPTGGGILGYWRVGGNATRVVDASVPPRTA